MRQALLLSIVLIGLTVLPLYNSSKTSCDFNWDTIDRYHGDIVKYYILFTGYENISNFDIRSADIADGYDKMRNKIKPFRLYLPSPPKHSMTLQEVFIFISAKIQSTFKDKKEQCTWYRREQELLPTEFNLEKKLMEHAEPIFDKIIRFISESPTKNLLENNPVIKYLFKNEKNIRLKDISYLVRLQLRKPTKETKMLLQMTLTKFMTEHMTTDAIDTLACYIKQLDDIVFLQLLGVSKIEYHNFIETLRINTLQTMEIHGLSPYKELAYALVEELSLINLYDIIFNWYSIIMTAVEVIHGMDLNENLRKIVDAWTRYELNMKTLGDEVICHKWPGIEKNMLKMLENLESESLLTVLHKYTPRIIREIARTLGYSKTSVPSNYTTIVHWMDLGSWMDLTAYLKTNRGVINELFMHKIGVSDMKDLLGRVMSYSYSYGKYFYFYDFDGTIGSLFNWVDHSDFPLFTNVTLSNEERDAILEPNQQVFDAFALVLKGLDNM